MYTPTRNLSSTGTAARREGSRWVLYVEGARDREILQSWARRISPHFARDLSESTLILGGRRPARAEAHQEELRRAHGHASGLCLLDRDEHDPPQHPQQPGTDGELETFTWQRRHIESYLLVPTAIRRGLRLGDRERPFSRVLDEHLPEPGDEESLRDVDAKRILGPKGPLARWLGRPLHLGNIARGMRADEMHADVHRVLARIQAALGWLD